MAKTTKRGRPPTFDREEALRQAMELFWARGYEGVTLEDLLAGMGGISPPSFYHAFGSKAGVFQEAIDLYVATVGDRAACALREGRTARESVEAMLRSTAEAVSTPGKPCGCLLVVAAAGGPLSSKGPQDYARAMRQRAPAVIQQRLRRAVVEGELPQSIDTAAIAAFYATVVHGLGVCARDGDARDTLMSAVDGAMAAWNMLTAPARAKPRRRRDARGPIKKPIQRGASRSR